MSEAGQSTPAPEERILLLDDEESIVELLTGYLRGRGYACEACTSPFDALDLLRRETFALLLCDLKMPKMSGIEVLRQAREIDPNLSVIVVTALLDVSMAIQAIRLGADDYVLKPFNLSEITLSVSRALEKRRALLEAELYQQELSERVHEATNDLERVNSELQDTKQYLQSLLDSIIDGILTIGPDNAISYANSGAAQMSGYPIGELAGMPARQLFSNADEELAYITRILDEGRFLKNYETEVLRKDGERVPVSMSISRVRSEQHVDEGGVLAVLKDITEQKRLQHELQELSIRDSLTNLYNQGHFYERLRTEIERARRQGHPLSLLLLDVDAFKAYNDSHGHIEGDQVLQTLAAVLLDCTRDHVDIGFRYGGDEFTVILPEADDQQAYAIAERIRSTFEAKRLDHLTLSIGVMSYHEGYSLKSFIQYADSKMYEAKRAGGNRVYFYDTGHLVCDDAAQEEDA